MLVNGALALILDVQVGKATASIGGGETTGLVGGKGAGLSPPPPQASSASDSTAPIELTINVRNTVAVKAMEHPHSGQCSFVRLIYGTLVTNLCQAHAKVYLTVAQREQKRGPLILIAGKILIALLGA
jgi:hypothetical protein